jgi:hypothetical protein
MAINTRQQSLLVADNWKKIYQTFQEADFTSYDFETLRKSMIDYLRIYYPEDFNDFTESSEFVALIDLIAFLGQSLAFRTDLNARENFIDTAERRDSVLKLARLVSYSPKRNIPASGFIKIEGINTTEAVYDSNGLNLRGSNVNWNDSSNDNWHEQFITILNAALSTSQVVGKPGNTQTINGIRTEEYGLNLISNILGTYKFEAQVEGNKIEFEAVSATSVGKSYVYEAAPKANSLFNILYRNDNYGNGSNNTGFFVYFKQGTLANQDFSLTDSIPNRVVSFDNGNVNNTDVWLYGLSTNGTVQNLWRAVPAVAGINVIYNKQSDRNLYQINSRAGDQIDLVFGDGSFANIPQGNFRIYYRSSNGLSYKITPDEMQNIVIPVSYVSRSGRAETLTIRASLKYTVTTAAARETSDDIRQRAPQAYYTQNRMITGEDYNIVPFTTFSNILKVKSINRTSSGISRFLDTLDTTGKYSSTNVVGTDGILYQNYFTRNFKTNLVSYADISNTITQKIVADIISANEIKHLYYAKFPTYAVNGFTWKLSTVGSNSATGYFVKNSKPAQVGGVVKDAANYIRKGAVIRFDAPTGHYFDSNNNLLPGAPSMMTDHLAVYASVVEVAGDGTNNGLGNYTSGVGPVTTNIKVPTNAIVGAVYPIFKNNFNSSFVTTLTKLFQDFNTFGITYNKVKQDWQVITEQNLGSGEFDLINQGSTSSTGQDNSWIIKAVFTNTAYIIYYRGLEYVFQSAGETTFFYDDKTKVYDSKTGKVLRDQITVLKTNSQADSAAPLGYDYVWYIDKSIVDPDGFSNNDKILVTYQDQNSDLIPDNPRLFEHIVAPAVSPDTKLVYFQSVNGYDRFKDMISVDAAGICSKFATQQEILSNIGLFISGQLFYATQEKVFYQLTASHTLIVKSDYQAIIGRQNITFQYRHNSPESRRIDPSSTNVMDLYILTATYQADYQNWIKDTSNSISKPVPPTSQELDMDFNSLNDQRSVSDTIIFNSAVFKPIFGNKAEHSLQATFKVVKNVSLSTSDNDIKSSVINAINTYFDINNWDFGETFYFSELSAYLHQALTPTISSIVIVPTNPDTSFGNLYQINAEPYEIIISAATVENVEIISSITASQLNMGLK